MAPITNFSWIWGIICYALLSVSGGGKQPWYDSGVQHRCIAPKIFQIYVRIAAWSKVHGFIQ